MSGKKTIAVEKRVKDPVSEMRVFKESVMKEKRSEKIYEDFQINTPQHLNPFTDKPNTNKILLMKYKEEGKTINGVDYEEVLDAEGVDNTQLPEHITNRLSTMNEVPKNKANFPQTANQEIGWFVANGGPGSKFTYPRKGCNQTGYADDYYTMKHYSPFSNKNK